MPVIEVKNLSKKYNIVHQKNGSSYIALRDVLTNLAKHPFKSAKNIMKQKLGIGIEEFWALKDINFSVKKGEVLGIIGPNGAGKSTLLKILSQITPPTTGEIKMKGRVGSLLEVGTGFNPELTGRENVYLNGAILGMTKKEISDKFNNIIEFSGVEKFIDTPVKRYSSGMIVRLGFSVAVHLEPDILLVDEVLAVGDLGFQAQCFDKINELMNAGITIALVSHNMKSIMHYATKVLFINNGKMVFMGNPQEACEQYTLQQTRETDSESMAKTITHGNQMPPSLSLKNISFKMVDSLDIEKTEVMIGKEIKFRFSFFCSDKIDNLQIGIIIYKDGMYLAGIDSLIDGLKLSINNESFNGILRIPQMNLAPGKYTAVLALTNRGKFLLRGCPIDFSMVSKREQAGFIELPHKWQV